MQLGTKRDTKRQTKPNHLVRCETCGKLYQVHSTRCPRCKSNQWRAVPATNADTFVRAHFVDQTLRAVK